MADDSSVVLITGGGRGIGRSTALAFAAAGAPVAVAARSAVEIDAVAAECRAHGVEATAVIMDVRDAASVRDGVERCQAELGPVGVLINNAGIASSQKFAHIQAAVWQETLDVNLTGPFRLTRAVLPGMLARGSGAVITIASIAGKIGGAYIAPYTAAKHAAIGLMRSLAVEYARCGVTFNCVCPGFVDTPMTERSVATIMSATGRSREEALRVLYTPQGRLVRPEEVAAMCVFLAGPGGRSINGQALNIDGGQVQS